MPNASSTSPLTRYSSARRKGPDVLDDIFLFSASLHPTRDDPPAYAKPCSDLPKTLLDQMRLVPISNPGAMYQPRHKSRLSWSLSFLKRLTRQFVSRQSDATGNRLNES